MPNRKKSKKLIESGRIFAFNVEDYLSECQFFAADLNGMNYIIIYFCPGYWRTWAIFFAQKVRM